MLGFGALTEKYPYRTQTIQKDRRGFTGSSTTEIQSHFNRFNRVLDICVHKQELYGGIQAMLFSDCAFLNPETSLRAGIIAAYLMREFIKVRVPVRMGIAQGTFYAFGHSLEAGSGTMMVSKSRFLGTAVVRAHAASEKSGHKGMRILVHPKVTGLQQGHTDLHITALKKPSENAAWELGFLHRREPESREPTADLNDRELFTAVAEMLDPSQPPKVRRHYLETLRLMNLNRSAYGRRKIGVRTLRKKHPYRPEYF